MNLFNLIVKAAFKGFIFTFFIQMGIIVITVFELPAMNTIFKTVNHVKNSLTLKKIYLVSCIALHL